MALDYAVMNDSLNVFPALFEEELGAHTSLLQCAINNSYRIARLIREVATSNGTSLVSFTFS